MKAKKILVTSGAGGVGKTSFCANLALTLARAGHRVLLCDFDISGRALQTLLGCDDRVIHDMADISKGRVPPSDAIIPLAQADGLFFAAAPSDGANLFPGAKDLSSALERSAEAIEAEFVLMDFSCIDTTPPKIAAACCDMAIVVTRQSLIGARAAETAGRVLSERGAKEVRLIINRFSLENCGEAYPSAIDLVDMSRLQLLGIVPEANSIPRLEETGRMACLSRETRTVAAAYRNISDRLTEQNIPLLSRMHIIGRGKFIMR